MKRHIAVLALIQSLVGALAPSAIGAEEVPFVRPGHEGEFNVVKSTYVPGSVREIGILAGRPVQMIDTPCESCEMGKQMVVDADDNVWFLQTREDKVVKVKPETLEMTVYKLPLGSGPYSMGIGGDGTIWLTAHGIEMLLEFDPKMEKVTTHQPPSHGFLVHIAVDTQRNQVYFAQPGANKIVAFNRDSGFREYPIPTPNSGPARLAVAKDGMVWFPELYTNKLALLDPNNGKITEWDLPTPNGFPSFARISEKDGSIWISQPMADKIVQFKDGKFREYQVPTKDSIVSTQVEDDDGNIWFTEGGWRGSAGGNKIGFLDLGTGTFEELEMPIGNAQPAGITRTNRGEIWFQLSAKGKIVRVKGQVQTTTGALTVGGEE